MSDLVRRDRVAIEETWNLQDISPSSDAWESELKAVDSAIPGIQAFEGHLSDGIDTFKACLEAFRSSVIHLDKLGNYANLQLSEDGSNTASQVLAGKFASSVARFDSATAFIRTETLRLPGGVLEGYLKEDQAYFKEFKGFLDELINMKPYMLSPETEVVLAALGEIHDSPYMIYERAKSSDMSFEPIKSDDGTEIPISFALYEEKFETNPDFELSRKAWDSFVAGLSNYKNTLGATFATEVKKNVAISRVRHYPSATHMLLQPQKVTVDMYNTVLDTIPSELAPHMRRYAQLRKRVLRLDKMIYPNIELALDPEYNPSMSYDEASDLIVKSLSVMGPEYSKIIRKAFCDRWIDRAANIGKSTGAFCASPPEIHPYILMTWTGNMRGAFTLAHELGHAGHSVLAERAQSYFNIWPSTFFVEAPSTMNELLLANHILSISTDTRMRRWVLVQMLATYHHNFVRHLLEGELMRRIYNLAEQDEPITAETLSSTKGDILQEFWNGEVEIDEGAKLTWMRQPHYYMGLYPYTYAAGLTVATAVSQMILEEGEPAVARWLETLRAGGTLTPLELAKLAGVDMSSAEPMKKAVAFVGSLVDELERSF